MKINLFWRLLRKILPLNEEELVECHGINILAVLVVPWARFVLKALTHYDLIIVLQNHVFSIYLIKKREATKTFFGLSLTAVITIL